MLEKSEQFFMNKIKKENLKLSILNLKEQVKLLWTSDAPKIIKGYTDHGYQHCERIIIKLYKLLEQQKEENLTEEETYLLLAGIYLHDIGMQCDVYKYPEIKSTAEKFGANFDINFSSKLSDEYTKPEQDEIRKNHHFLSAAWIDYAYLSGKTILATDIKKIDNTMIRDLIEICMFHSKLPINDCREKCYFNIDCRKQLIAALLRLGDELDIDKERVNIETVETFNLEDLNSSFWWLHDHISINFEKNELIIIISLNSSDAKKYSDLFEKRCIHDFASKNKSVLNILIKNNFPVIISEQSKVVINEYSSKIPENVIKLILNLEGKKKAPVAELVNEVKIWLGALGYELTEYKQTDDSCYEMIVTISSGTIYQKVLVCCVDGEITYDEVLRIDNKLDRKIPQAWIISEKRISKRAKSYCDYESNIQLFNLAELLRTKIWNNYIENINKLIDSTSIPKLYVDTFCCKKEVTEDESINESKEGSLLRYIDDWLVERGKVHISLLGDFGSGKTWFCRYYTHVQLSRYINNPINERFPLLITLRDFVKSSTMQQLINDALLEQYKLPFLGGAFNIFNEMNKSGKLLLIFDGFDEMARKSDYQTVVDNFWNLAELVNEKSKIILTSRTEYFRWANETEKIFNGRENSKKIMLLDPKFDVLYIEPFNKEQIIEVIIKRYGEPDGIIKANSILKKSNLAEMAKKPILIELLLAALDDVDVEKLQNISSVYLYATNKLLLKNIKEERTFTSTKDKLFFLCELAWEMLKKQELKMHYKQIPEIIKIHFNDKIKDQHDLDNWDYDLRSQTLLHNNLAGYYEFAHKSLAEYFVALKFACELGCVSESFLSIYNNLSEFDSDMPYNKKDINELSETFGSKLLEDSDSSAIVTFLYDILDKDKIQQLWSYLEQIKGKDDNEVKYLGSNLIKLLKDNEESFIEKDLSNLCLTMANLDFLDLSNTTFKNSNLAASSLHKCVLKNVNFYNANLEDAMFSLSPVYGVNFKNANLKRAKINDVYYCIAAWVSSNELIISTVNSELITININGSSNMSAVFNPKEEIRYMEYNNFTNTLFAQQGKFITELDKESLRILRRIPCNQNMTNGIYLSKNQKYIASTHGNSSVINVWNIETFESVCSINTETGWCNSAVYVEGDNKVITTGYKGEIYICDIRNEEKKLLYKIKNANNAFQLRVNGLEDKLYVISTYGKNKAKQIYKMNIWSYPDFKGLIEISFDINTRVADSDISNRWDKVALLITEGNFTKVMLYLLDTDFHYTEHELFSIENHDYNFTSVRFSDDGMLLLCEIAGEIGIWNTNSNDNNFTKIINTVPKKVNIDFKDASGLSSLAHWINNFTEVETDIETFLEKRSESI